MKLHQLSTRQIKDFMRSMLLYIHERSGYYMTELLSIPIVPQHLHKTELSLFLCGSSQHSSTLSWGSTHNTPAFFTRDDGATVDPDHLSQPLDIELFPRNLRFLWNLLSLEPLCSQQNPGRRHNPSACPNEMVYRSQEGERICHKYWLKHRQLLTKLFCDAS